MKPFIIGTRGSELALWQANKVKEVLSKTEPDLHFELKIISTRGDQQQQLSLSSGQLTKGLFTEELEKELLSGAIDFAVHSLKDLPVELPKGICLSGVLPRGDVRDVIVSRSTVTSIQDINGMQIGSSSPRRIKQLEALLSTREDKRGHTTFSPIRGNVPTRIQKVLQKESAYDATILAMAGVQRLDLENHISYIIPLEEMLPAPGQATIAIQCATQNSRACELAEKVSDDQTMLTTTIERKMLSLLGGGCALPFGAYCKYTDEKTGTLSLAIAFHKSKLIKKEYTLSVDAWERELPRIATSLKNNKE